MTALRPLAPPAWRHWPGLSPYAETVAAMEAHAERLARGEAEEEIWLVEHPPVITAGTSQQPADLLQPDRFPVVATGRGGRFTYHGPGQRVVYPILNLGARGRDVRRYVSALEQWAIAALALIEVEAEANAAGTGIWVRQGGALQKIGAIGVRVRRWISFHGMALNVSTDLDHFRAIVPCGISGHGVARLADVAPGSPGMADLDDALRRSLPVLLHGLAGSDGSPIKTLEAAGDCR